MPQGADITTQVARTPEELAAWVDTWLRLDTLRPMTVERMQRSQAGGVDPMWGVTIRRGNDVVGGARLSLFAWEGASGTMRMDARAFDRADTAAVLDAAVAATDAVRAEQAPASTFYAFVEASDLAPVEHLRSRGFVELERSRISTLDLVDAGAAARPTPPPGIELTDLAHRPDLALAAFRLERAAFARIPSDLPQEPEMDLDWWLERIGAATLEDHSLVLLALDAGEVVGLIEMSPPGPSSRGGYIRFTGVAESHLRRGIARALKDAAAHLGAQRGWDALSASNAEANAAIVALNEATGYRQVGVRVVMERRP